MQLQTTHESGRVAALGDDGPADGLETLAQNLRVFLCALPHLQDNLWDATRQREKPMARPKERTSRKGAGRTEGKAPRTTAEQFCVQALAGGC